MKIGIIHETVTGDSRADELDVLDQARIVEQALGAFGHESWTEPVGLDLSSLAETIRRRRPDCIFNLVESLGGHGRLIHLVPALLEALNVPFTGCGSGAMLLTTNKVLAKELLLREGVTTPSWCTREKEPIGSNSFPNRWLLKPIWEDASVGIADDALVVADDVRSLGDALEKAARRGIDAFAEEFIEGREFNLSVLAGEDGPEVLPPAEIEFIDFPQDKPRIVGYRAKWQKGSPEYEQTPRRFDFPQSDRPLLESLSAVAVRCWELFHLRGYARVDFRVDNDLRPWVLEVNANPCLAEDAGFMAAAGRAGLDARSVVQRIITDSLRPAPQGEEPSRVANQAGF